MILTHAKVESLEKYMEGNKKDATRNIFVKDRTQATRKEMFTTCTYVCVCVYTSTDAHIYT